jgi:hypothetical protein
MCLWVFGWIGGCVVSFVCVLHANVHAYFVLASASDCAFISRYDMMMKPFNSWDRVPYITDVATPGNKPTRK